MCKKSIVITSFALALSVTLIGLATAGEPGLEGWWKFDGDGLDSSGNDRNGTFMNGAGLATGYSGQALYLDGSGAYFNVDGYKGIVGDGVNTPPFSIAVWIKKEGPVGGDGEIVGWGSTGSGNRMEFRFNSGNNRVRIESGGGNAQNDTQLTTGQWHHVALTVRENSTYESGPTFYLDGVDDTRSNTDPDPIHPIENFDVKMGARYNLDNRHYTGYIDDVRIYDRVLTVTEVGDIINLGYLASAYSPDPPDGSLYTETWANLSWTTGNLAVSHDLYLGENFEDVDAGAESVFIGNMTTTLQIIGFPGFPYPDGLAPGKTYYWRVDEVNEAHLDSPWRGKVWSFTIPFKTGYNPNPVDGAQFETTEVDLSWEPGMNAIMHAVYFGTDADEIANATGASGEMGILSFDPGPLENETAYYWRVDTFNGAEWIKGPLWSFTTMPVIPMTDDPTLVAWWKLDEDPGTTVVDWSGYGHHGRFIVDDVRWVEGIYDGALEFPGGWVEMTDYEGILGTQNRTVAAWIKTTGYGDYISWGVNDDTLKWIGRVQDDASNGTVGALRTECSGGYIIGSTVLTDNQWHHVTSVLETVGTASIDDIKLYVDGRLEVISGWQAIDVNTASDGRTVWLGEGHHGRLFPGQLDDVRIYERALTEDEIKLLMRGDLSLAWDPEPRTGQEVDLDNALPLRWNAGNKASEHDVYFGLDKEAVKNADTSDASGIYRGRQSATSYTPPEGVEWSGGPYYWRIDEYNTDGTISQGRVWVFTVVDFILVEDFESYTDNDTDGEAIWQHWIDGFGIPGNGAQVGYLMPPYAEQTIIHSGLQSMPLLYDNTAGVTNSEAVLTLTAPRDWTKHGLASLSLWFRGYPGSVGSFVEAPAGTYTMTASGADIGGTADRCHFAFKTLTGAGSITARVNSIQNTNAWAKAGVMIRETLEAGSKNAFVCVTPGNGVIFQGRTEEDATGFSANQTGITAPHWVKLERDAAGNFTVSHSANGVAWESVADSIPTNISMDSNVYIGLALTSHDVVLTGEAVFSNVTISGSVGGQWTHQDLGISSNAAEPMYVAISNANGTTAVVAHEDPGAATIDEWTQWVIPLPAFADQGVNLTDVDSVAIGLGTTAGAAASGGSGKMYFDDIRLYPPAPEPDPQP
jgi:hypothetical protein